MPSPLPYHRPTLCLLSLSLPTLFTATMSTAPQPPSTPTFPTRPYTPRHPSYPYTPPDFTRMDNTPDTEFYSTPRFVTHIDDFAIARLKQYYTHHLPRSGKILDLCSSWVSHLPPELETLAAATSQRLKTNPSPHQTLKPTDLEITGLGLNARELAANPALTSYLVHDLNNSPSLPPLENLTHLTSSTCAVSIDYLTSPLPVLASILRNTIPGGSIHIAISNRCFPTKAVGRWLRVSEKERTEMVGDFLWWAGWRGVEVVELSGGGEGGGGGWVGGIMSAVGMEGGSGDPLWVVRGVKIGEGEAGDGGGESEVVH